MKVGISQALLSEYERGEVRIHGELVAAFAKTLRVSSDELLGLKTPKHNGFFPDRRFLRRLQKIEQLSRRDKQALLKTIDGYLKGAGVDWHGRCGAPPEWRLPPHSMKQTPASQSYYSGARRRVSVLGLRPTGADAHEWAPLVLRPARGALHLEVRPKVTTIAGMQNGCCNRRALRPAASMLP